MKKFYGAIMLLFFLIAFFLHILALMKIFPLLISIPLLLIAIFIPAVLINDRKRFKGF
ncbi:hypothetical protein [Bacillus sp. FJAT-29814]|uniref:hypothetical protein n=1 Tax=Bacillus sp. FJAT-29814 TaxID=1729688 RepID=UPI000AA9FEB7|nr:hypothetical protein [Bacillus sp. FJAT-29814]